MRHDLGRALLSQHYTIHRFTPCLQVFALPCPWPFQRPHRHLTTYRGTCVCSSSLRLGHCLLYTWFLLSPTTSHTNTDHISPPRAPPTCEVINCTSSRPPSRGARVPIYLVRQIFFFSSVALGPRPCRGVGNGAAWCRLNMHSEPMEGSEMTLFSLFNLSFFVMLTKIQHILRFNSTMHG